MRVVLTALFAAVAAAFGASAQDVFTVAGVKVDATAASGAAARDVALANGQAAAARRLFERLTLPEDQGLLPVVDSTFANQLVTGMQVQNEKASGTRYIATLTFSFDPASVRAVLRGADTPFVESRSRPVVVVPLWRENGETRLWSDNPWLDALRNGGFDRELVPLIAPVGDLEEISNLPAEAVARLDTVRLESLAKRYGADRVLVARAQPSGSGAGASLTEVRFGEGAAIIDRGVLGARALDELATRTAAVLQEEWKRRAIVRGGGTNEVRISVLYDGLADWRRLQTALGGASLIEDARLDAMTRDGALMTVNHRGRPDQLALELSERGVDLQTSDVVYVARLTGGFGFGASRR